MLPEVESSTIKREYLMNSNLRSHDESCSVAVII